MFFGSAMGAGIMPCNTIPGPPMDLLEYKGKLLFARHDVPVPEGKAADSVEEAVEAAEAVGYPCVVKAQVQIGGRGQGGGDKGAPRAAPGQGHAQTVLRAANPRAARPG